MNIRVLALDRSRGRGLGRWLLHGGASLDGPNVIYSVDDLARRLWKEKNFNHDACKRLLQRACLECRAARKRKINEGTAGVALGAYSHGNHYGTTGSLKSPSCVRMLISTSTNT